jgi:hypothetical protein
LPHGGLGHTARTSKGIYRGLPTVGPGDPPTAATFTLAKYLKYYISRFPRPEMSFARAGKAAANETKYPFIIEVPVTSNGLNVELNRQIVGFHKSHNTPPRFGRTAFRDGQIYYRWCFFDLATARAFAEQFGGAFYKTTGT